MFAMVERKISLAAMFQRFGGVADEYVVGHWTALRRACAVARIVAWKLEAWEQESPGGWVR